MRELSHKILEALQAFAENQKSGLKFKLKYVPPTWQDGFPHFRVYAEHKLTFLKRLFSSAESEDDYVILSDYDTVLRVLLCLDQQEVADIIAPIVHDMGDKLADIGFTKVNTVVGSAPYFGDNGTPA